VAPLPDKVAQADVSHVLPMFGQVMGTSTAKATLNGEEVDVLYAGLKWPDGSELRLTFTNAIPGYGLWRVEMGKRVVLEALTWGEPAEEAPQPAAAGASAAAPASEAAASAEATPAHPLFDAKAGEWYRFRQTGRNAAEMEMTVKVVEVTDDEVVVQRTMSIGGREVRSRPVRRPKVRQLTEGVDATLSKDTVTVGSRTLDCIVMTTHHEVRDHKIWICPQVPVDGVVRMEADGVVVRELIDWGTDG
jgi:hypothetical protein